MKASVLSVKESTWTSEERHLVEELHGESQGERLCLPKIFRSKKVKSLTRAQTSPAYQVYYTARELLLEALDKDAIQELMRRAPGGRTGAHRPSHSLRERSSALSEEEHSEALTWFSVVLQSGLSAGENCSFGSEATRKLDRQQGVLKRNSMQTKLLSLTRLEDRDKLEALSAFCSHLSRRYQTLHTPGPSLAVKKYTLSDQGSPCSLHLALLCDLSSGFICNTYLYCPEQLRKQSAKPVVEQVLKYLVGPFCTQNHVVQLDSSVSSLQTTLSGLGLNIHFVPTASPSSSSVTPQQDQSTSEDAESEFVAHLQGWTGAALLLHSYLKGSAADVFLPGLWATLHMICINTYVLHTLQSLGSGRSVRLTDFTRALASQLATDSSSVVPVLPRLNSCSYRETSLTHYFKPRSITNSSDRVTDDVKTSSSSGAKLHTRWNKPGVCGLDNSGNSCYLNAVLQCLCSTVPLVEHLLNQDTRRELAKCKCKLTEVFVRLLEKMWSGSSSICTPAEARSTLCSILPQFNNYSQQDAQELLLYLLNVLHDDLKKVAKHQMRSSRQHPRKEQNRTCTESTIVSRLFKGQLSYVTLCTHCDHQAHNSQSFTVLSLPIPKDSTKCSIQDCLSLFFEETVLTGGEQMLCSECCLKRETAVLTCLEKPPEILLLHLKRFSSKGRNQVKLRTNVVFSMKLDLAPFLSSSVQNSSLYHLYAVVNHMGHLNMGHYTAVCYNGPARTWHCFDDEDVRELQDSLVQSPNAYMLLYTQKLFQKPKIQGL